jgi:hypothetical protein
VVKELDPILAWIERQGVGKAAQQNTPGLLGCIHPVSTAAQVSGL